MLLDAFRLDGKTAIVTGVAHLTSLKGRDHFMLLGHTANPVIGLNAHLR